MVLANPNYLRRVRGVTGVTSYGLRNFTTLLGIAFNLGKRGHLGIAI